MYLRVKVNGFIHYFLKFIIKEGLSPDRKKLNVENNIFSENLNPDI